MFFDFSKLLSLNIGVDFGSYKTRAVSAENGFFYNKFSLISIFQKDKTVLAVGDGSKEMVGRVPAGVLVVKPVQNSEITSNQVFELYVKDLIKEISSKNNSFKLVTKPDLYIPVNSDFTKAQESNFENSLKKEGVNKVVFLKKPLVSFYGLGEVGSVKNSVLIIDLGFNKTDIGLVFNNNLVDSKTLDFGGQDINNLIYQKLIDDKKLQVSDENIENLKKSSLVLYPSSYDHEKFEVIGKSIRTGLPLKIEISIAEFRDMVMPLIKSSLINPLKSFLNSFTENVSNDIFENGVILIGGSSQIYSLKLLLNKEFNINFYIPKNPENVVVDGLKKVIFTLLLIVLLSVNPGISIRGLLISYSTPFIEFNKNLFTNLSLMMNTFGDISRLREENFNLKNKEFILVSKDFSERVSQITLNEYEKLKLSIENDSYFKDKKYEIVEIIYLDKNTSRLFIKKRENYNIGSPVMIGRFYIGVIVAVNSSNFEVELWNKSGRSLNTVLLNKSDENQIFTVRSDNYNTSYIENILSTESVNVGDYVVTSSTNAQIPSNLFLGIVDRVEGVSSQTFRKALIKKQYELEKSNYVVILKND